MASAREQHEPEQYHRHVRRWAGRRDERMLPVRVSARVIHRQPAQRPQQDVRGRAAMARRLCDVAELVNQHHQHAKQAIGDEHEREGRAAS